MFFSSFFRRKRNASACLALLLAGGGGLAAFPPSAWARPNLWAQAPTQTLLVPSSKNECGLYPPKRSCGPGETFTGEAVVATTNLSQGAVRIGIQFCGADGRVLGYGGPLRADRPNETAASTVSPIRLGVTGKAPEGTTQALFYLQMSACNPGARATFQEISFARQSGSSALPGVDSNLWPKATTQTMRVPSSKNECGSYAGKRSCTPGDTFTGETSVTAVGLGQGLVRIGIQFCGADGRALTYGGSLSQDRPHQSPSTPGPVHLGVVGTAPEGATQVMFYLQMSACAPEAQSTFQNVTFSQGPLPAANAGSSGAHQGQLPLAMSLLDRVPYVAAERRQGASNCCYVWSATTLIEMEMLRKYGIRERLSVQFFGSYSADPRLFLEGDNEEAVQKFYNEKRILVPWSNPNAEYRSEAGAVPVEAGNDRIITEPNYKLNNVSFRQLFPVWATRDQLRVTETIKESINSGRPVMLLTTPTVGVGHYTLIVGYNQAQADPNEHYWLMLDSFGVSAAQPDATFKRLMRHLDFREQTVREGDGGPCAAPITVDQPVYTMVILDDLNLALEPQRCPAPVIHALATDLQVGQRLKLMAEDRNCPPLRYQWYRNGLALPAQTGSTLVIPQVCLGDAGNYAVAVGNAIGTTRSPEVPVTVGVI